jgi:hypothetical protein
MDAIPCIDGYPLQPGSPLADGHDALNWYLVRVDEVGWKTATKEVSALRDKSLKLRIWRALLDRLRWLRDNDPHGRSFGRLRDLTNAIEKWSLAVTDDDLRTLLRETADMAGTIAPYTPMPHLMGYVADHGLTPALAGAIDDFAARVRGTTYTINQTSWQLLWSRLDMLAWRNEWNDADPKRCCTEQIRIDFRQMRGAERERWRQLLHSIDGDQTPRPAPRWLKRANESVHELGVAGFSTRMIAWLGPLRRGTTARLSRPGSHILRALIWIAAPLNDPALMEPISGIRDVRFTPKLNGEKVIHAAANAVGEPLPTAAPTGPSTLDDLTIRALKTVLSSAAWGGAPAEVITRVEFDGTAIRVRGNLDRYRVHTSTGEVFRESDGKRIDVAVDTHHLPVPAPLMAPNVVKLLAQVLVLADDSSHRHAIRVIEKGS